MSGYAPTAIDDLVNTTLNRVKRDTWDDLSLSTQYHILSEYLLKGKTETISSSPTQQWELQIANNGNFKATTLYGQDRTNVRNLIIKATQAWAIYTNNFTYDLREEAFQGDNLTRIVNLVKVRRHSMMVEAIDGLESHLWTAPSSSALNPMTFSGFPFWLQASATEGFNGGDPSGWSSGAANVATGTYANWKNWTFSYSLVNDLDYFAKCRKAMEWTNFLSPDPHPSTTKEKPQWMLYQDWDTKEQIERALTARTDDVRDAAGIAYNKAKFNSVSMMWVPVFDDSTNDAYVTNNPTYGINWSAFNLEFQEGFNFKVGAPGPTPVFDHNVRMVPMDIIMNLNCKNRRKAGFRAYRV